MSKSKKTSLLLILLAILLAGNYYLISKDIKQKILYKELLEKKKELLIEQNSLLEDLKSKIEEEIKLKQQLLEREKNSKTIKAIVTAFNTTPEQTDENPCMAKFGYICDRDDVVACPRHLEAHTEIKILGKEYECMDWTAEKYNGRFDICFGKDIQSAKQFGIQYLEVTIYAKES